MLTTATWSWPVETCLHALPLTASDPFNNFPKLQIITKHIVENLPFSIPRAKTVLSYAPKALERSITDYSPQTFTSPQATISPCRHFKIR